MLYMNMFLALFFPLSSSPSFLSFSIKIFAESTFSSRYLVNCNKKNLKQELFTGNLFTFKTPRRPRASEMKFDKEKKKTTSQLSCCEMDQFGRAGESKVSTQTAQALAAVG